MDLQPLVPPRLTGSEPIAGTAATVLDFWKFAMSDLRTNSIRGYVAELRVSQAVKAETARVAWDPWRAG